MKSCPLLSTASDVVLRAIIFYAIFDSLEKRCEAALTHNNDNEIQVRIREGKLRGKEDITFLNNVTYYSFLGIPFAKPPMGNLRFKDPEPVDPWKGVLDATKEGNACPQVSVDRKFLGHEDCLNLNVFTPKFRDVSKKYPVMVWIHGGGFTFGNGSPKNYPPDSLIEQDVILVYINYRLGAFGFLNVLTKDAPGNAGLKDQVLALKWVKKNIRYFHGDQNNVTIFGESAGSASVQYHMLSPLSKGLFHRAIMESGSVLNPWALTKQPKERVFRLGKLLGFKNGTEKSLVEFLGTVSSSDLILGQLKLLDPENLKQCIDVPFPPSVEKHGTGKNFLTEPPRTLLKTGKFARVPTIIGFNSNEGILSLVGAFTTKKSYGDDYGRFIPEELALKKGSKKYNNLAKSIKKFFFQGNPIDTDHLEDFTSVCGDLFVMIGVNETINYILSTPGAPDVYAYEFTFDGKLASVKGVIQQLRPDLNIPNGVSHADELGYIFPQEYKIKQVTSNSTEMKILDQVTRMWTNFAKYKTPNGEKVQTKWKPTKKHHAKYLDIGENLTLYERLFMETRLKFWNIVFRKYHRHTDL